MNPDLLLRVVAALAGFLLKTTLALGVCLVFSWFIDSPNRRFMTWLAFLYGAAAYWLWLAKGFLAGAQSASAPSASVQPVASSAGAWQIPGSWAFPLGITLRAIGIAYLLILGYFFITHIKKQRQLKWVLSFTTEPPAETAEIFRRLVESLHVGRSRLLMLSGATSPATFGWFRPTILLPALCLEQDRSELEDILRHELHHVRRWDFAWNGVAILCRVLLFFHPAAWYALRKMQFDRELACDLAVISDSPGRRALYAECLVHFARLNLAQDPKAWGIDFAASSEHLKARVHSILAGSKKRSGWLLGLRAAGGLTLLAGFLGVVPSLAVFLSYSRSQIAQPLTSTIRASLSGPGTGTGASRRVRSLSFPAPRSTDGADANVSGREASLAQPVTDSTYRKGEGTSPPLSAAAPRLLHRPPASATPGNTVLTQQTVSLIDNDASGQTGKSGDGDRNQALQQSATAAMAIYKRLSAVDRH
jgi:beta-lactamase regulating signal transducer with metallopeptidase domain